MLLDIFTKMESFNTKLLKSKGAVYLKKQGETRSIKVVPIQTVYAKTAALEYLGFFTEPTHDFYFYNEGNEYIFIIWHGEDSRRPWQVLYFLDKDFKPGNLCSLVIEAEDLSDKSCDVSLSFVPKGCKMIIHDIFNYEIIKNSETLNGLKKEEGSNIVKINFNSDAA